MLVGGMKVVWGRKGAGRSILRLWLGWLGMTRMLNEGC